MDILKNFKNHLDNLKTQQKEVILIWTGTKQKDWLKRKQIISNIAGPDFIYTDENKILLNRLFHYFNGNVEECEKLNINLSKGIAILGEYGCGKTMLFRLMHKYLSINSTTRKNTFKMVSLEDVLKHAGDTDFIESVYCYNVIENEHGVKVRNPVHLLVNEFGAKYNIKTFGTDVNDLLEMFWMKRYEIYTDYNKLTHITANIDLTDIFKNHSPKVVDRFKEMFQFEQLGGKSFRK